MYTPTNGLIFLQDPVWHCLLAFPDPESPSELIITGKSVKMRKLYL